MDPFCLVTYPYVIGYLAAVRMMESTKLMIELWDTPNRLIFGCFYTQAFRPSMPV